MDEMEKVEFNSSANNLDACYNSFFRTNYHHGRVKVGFLIYSI